MWCGHRNARQRECVCGAVCPIAPSSEDWNITRTDAQDMGQKVREICVWPWG
jgi:hypothetical protein